MHETASSYGVFILENDFDFTISTFKGMCLCVEFPADYGKQTHSLYPATLIENKMLADAFFDYATIHVPACRAMSTEAALQYIDGLIKELEKSVEFS